MKNYKVRGLLSAICLAAIFAAFTRVDAGPVRFDQVQQIVNAKPGKAATGTFSRLRVAGDYSEFLVDDGEDDKKKTKPVDPQDTRVITETKTEIVEDEVCDCEPPEAERGFPKWWLLGLAAIPIGFIVIKRKKDTPTPTNTPPNQTPTPTGTPTSTPTVTPTPPFTPTPTPPEPIPEPMTILLFGTGLASIGLAARRRLGRKDRASGENIEE